MFIKKIKLKNFMPYEDVELDLSSIRLASILGKSEFPGQSNGTGKSSLIGAVSYALYGKERCKYEHNYIKLGASEMEVILYFEIFNKDVKIIRGRNISGSGHAKMFIDDQLIADGIKTVNLEVEKLLKISVDVFMATCFFGQGELDLFTRVTPSKRKDYLFSILDIEIWKDCCDLSKKKKKKLEDELIEIKKQIDFYESEEQEYFVAKSNLQEVRKQIKIIKHEISKLEIKHSDVKEEIIDKKLLVEDLAVRKEFDKTKKSISKLKGKFKELKDKYKILSKEVKDSKEWILENRNSSTIDCCKTKLIEISEVLAAERQNAKSIEKSLVFLSSKDNNGKKCPLCMQKLTHNVNKIVDILNKNLNVIGNKINELLINKKEIEVLFSRVKTCDEKKNRLKMLIQRKKSIKENAFNIKDLVESQEEYIEKISISLEKYEDYANVAGDIRILEGKLALLKTDINIEKANLERHNIELGGINIKMIKLKSLQSKISKLKLKQNKTENDIKLTDLMIAIFNKHDGIPSFIIENAVDSIENEANSMLKEFGSNQTVFLESLKETRDGRKVDTLDVIIHTSDGQKDYSLLSGGEKTQVNVALRLALSSLLINRHGTTIDSIFIDEALGALDSYNRYIIIDILKALSKKFKQIFLISHHDDIKDSLPDSIIVEKKGKTSIAYIEK